jgi:hypothetical protein
MRKLVPSFLVVLGTVFGAVPQASAEGGGWRVHVGGGGGYHAPAAPHYSGARVYSGPGPRALVGPRGAVVVHDYRFRGGVWVPPVRVWRPTWYYRYWWPYRGYYGYDTGYYGYYAAPACCAVEQSGYPAPPSAVQEPRIGLGIRASGTSFGKDQPTSEGIGGLLRVRLSRVELELEVGRDRYPDLSRNDTRVGGALIVPLFGTVLQPYVVGGLGVNFVELNDGVTRRTQGYLAGGGGLALNIGRGFTLAADARYVVRHYFNQSDSTTTPVVLSATTPPPTTDPATADREAGVEGRLSAIFYF